MKDVERMLAGAGGHLAGSRAAEAARRLAGAAGARGLLDVACATVDSPLGPLLLASTPRGLVRIAFHPFDEVMEELAGRISPRVLEAPRRLDPVRRELDEYFERRRRRFEAPLDWSLTGGFTRRVLEAAGRIPYGDVATYREVAAGAGNPRATRAAGRALGANPVPIVVACHRVVRSDGGLGGYGGGLDRKRFLLGLEGRL